MADELRSDTGESDAPITAAPQFVVKDPPTHTMQGSIWEYVSQKIHQDIRSKEWSKIIVRGDYSRSPPARVSDSEKTKEFNWHRPTTTIIAPNTLAVNCFPGLDLVEHYSSLVATYLALQGRSPSIVSSERPPSIRCVELFSASNLGFMGSADVVVIGYAYKLRSIRKELWQSSSDLKAFPPELLFSWQKRNLANGLTVAYLASRVSFWGDMAAHLVYALRHYIRPKCLIYLGKAGAIRPDISPNECLVTGEDSYLGEELVTWKSVLKPECSRLERVLKGNMLTIASPLCEDSEWLARWQSKGSWVDCEVGHIAKACNQCDIDFGYLHIISDNVSTSCQENLVNENESSVRIKRQELLDEAEIILDCFLARLGEPSAPSRCTLA